MLDGGKDNDKLYGEEGVELLSGGFDLDLDRLEGNKNFDTYIANDKDVIYDSDGEGEVRFEIAAKSFWSLTEGLSFL
ncbi:MAG: hypothetical protein LBF86_06140 [Helicobacteraceae bacterium]|nr:hypothetical protein [Helicobacteraceae bacterium]